MTRLHQMLLIFFVGLSGLLRAQTEFETYIKFDASCMKMYSYEKTGTFFGMPFHDFHVEISPYESFVFRVIDHPGYIKKQAPTPEKMISCQDTRLLSKDFIKAVNSGDKEVHIVLSNPNTKTLSLYSVRQVVHYHETPKELTYEDTRRTFTYRYDQIVTGEDLDKSDLRQINFEKREKLGACAVMRSFESFNSAQANYKEKLSFVEGIGLYKIESSKGALTLKTINGEDALAYIQNQCQQIKKPQNNLVNKDPETPKEADKPDENGSDPVVFNGFGNSLVARGGNANAEDPKNDAPNKKYNLTEVPEGHHLVQEGECLYTIAKKYNTREDVLIGLNGLKNNIIDHGMVLKVVNDGSYKDDNPSYVKEESTGATLIIHTVRQGENLWNIAKRYGTKVQNIRSLNNISEDKRDNINIGQQLIIKRQY